MKSTESASKITARHLARKGGGLPAAIIDRAGSPQPGEPAAAVCVEGHSKGLRPRTGRGDRRRPRHECCHRRAGACGLGASVGTRLVPSEQPANSLGCCLRPQTEPQHDRLTNQTFGAWLDEGTPIGALERRQLLQPYCDIGVKGHQARVEADQPPAVMACQTGQVGVGDLPVPEHAAPGTVGVSEAVGPKAVPHVRRDPSQHCERSVGGHFTQPHQQAKQCALRDGQVAKGSSLPANHVCAAWW